MSGALDSPLTSTLLASDPTTTSSLSESLTLGPIPVGCCIQLIFLGIGSMQSYLYFWNYGTDSRTLKAIVAGLWILEICDTVLGMAVLWRLLVDRWADQQTQGQVLGLVLVQCLVATVTAGSVQYYLILRVWRVTMGKSRIFPATMMALTVCPFAGLIWIFINMFGGTEFDFFLPPKYAIVVTVGVISAFVDTCIAINMIIVLSPYKTQFSSTRGLLHRAQILVINTGFFTALITIAILVLYLTRPYTLDLLALFIPLGTAYFCCLLTNLNARRFVRGEGGVIVATDLEAVRATDIVFATWQDAELDC